MTAKDSLRELVDRFSEEEAAVWLATVAQSRGVAVRENMDWDAFLATLDEAMDESPDEAERRSRELQEAIERSGGVRLTNASDW